MSIIFQNKATQVPLSPEHNTTMCTRRHCLQPVRSIFLPLSSSSSQQHKLAAAYSYTAWNRYGLGKKAHRTKLRFSYTEAKD